MSMKRISKSEFKPRAFEILRLVEQRGESIVITDHGIDAVRIEPSGGTGSRSVGALEGVIVHWDRPTEPVAEGDWDQELQF